MAQIQESRWVNLFSGSAKVITRTDGIQRGVLRRIYDVPANMDNNLSKVKKSKKYEPMNTPTREKIKTN
jgi:hypothetical protein